MGTLVRSRRVVLPDGVREAAVLIGPDGRITRIQGFDDPVDPDTQVVEAGAHVVMAGVVDSHVHVNEPGRTHWEGFFSATRAAAAGGVTAIADMPLNSIPPTTTRENLQAKLQAASGQVHVDVAFWGGLVPGNKEQLRDLLQAGVVGFKCFLCPTGVEEFSAVTPAEAEAAMEELQGTEAVLAFHAELEGPDKNPPVKEDPRCFQTFLKTRPPLMEVNAIRKIIELCQKYKVRSHIVHLSAADALPLVRAAKAQRLPLTAETCHHYLALSAEQVAHGATQCKCVPPLRSRRNQEALWAALQSGLLDMVVSDHSPAPADTKLLQEGDFLRAWGGIASLQFGLPLFWTEASQRGFGLVAVARLLCEKPARLCSLQRRKGSLQPGMDGDIVVWDPDAAFVVEPSLIHFKNKITPYMNKTLKGKVMRTIVRGRTVYVNGEDFPPPQGELILLSKTE